MTGVFASRVHNEFALDDKSFQASSSALSTVFQKAAKDGYVFISGHIMRQILAQLGATDADLDQLSMVFEDLGQDPVWQHRQNGQSRVLMHKTQAGSEFRASALPRACFRLGGSDVQHEDIVNVDRHFSPLPTWWDGNSAVRAYQQFMSALVDPSGEAAPGTDASSSDYVCLQLPTRIRHSKRLAGEPSPEGVHQDGCELAVMSLFSRQNIATASGSSRIWSLQQPPGKCSASTANMLKERTLSDKFDTLVVMDRRVKHEVLPIDCSDESKDAVRDVFILFARRPMLDGSDKLPATSLSRL